MPNQKTHTYVGSVSGLAAGLYHAREQVPFQRMVEVAGASVGGYWGGRLPDLLEPATSPSHRRIAHSCLALAVVGGATLEAVRRECRSRAEMFRLRQIDPQLDPLTRLIYYLLEIAWQFAAGFVGGLQAGYASHLVLDGCTPAGLPLLSR